MKERDITKLPMWAQSEIQRLTQDLAAANAKLSVGPEDSDTFADPYSDSARRPLGRGTLIQFGVERGERMLVRWEDGKLQVSSDGMGLAVQPRAANSVDIVARGW